MLFLRSGAVTAEDLGKGKWMFNVKFLAIIASLLFGYAMGGEARAMREADSNGYAPSPTVQLRSTVDQTIRILTDPSLQGDAQRNHRHQLARKVILTRFDFNEMAKRSLGPYWRSLTPEDQQRFVRLFTQFLEKIYLARIDEFSGEKFFYTGEHIDHGYAEVTSKVLASNGKDFTIRYKLHLVRNNWKIYDVVMENISIVNNYRSQFSRVIERASYQELVTRLEQKLAANSVN